MGPMAMPLRAKDPAQVAKDTAKDAVNNRNKIILLFFIRIPRREGQQPFLLFVPAHELAGGIWIVRDGLIDILEKQVI